MKTTNDIQERVNKVTENINAQIAALQEQLKMELIAAKKMEEVHPNIENVLRKAGFSYIEDFRYGKVCEEEGKKFFVAYIYVIPDTFKLVKFSYKPNEDYNKFCKKADSLKNKLEKALREDVRVRFINPYQMGEDSTEVQIDFYVYL